jgi:hypothetical protein
MEQRRPTSLLHHLPRCACAHINHSHVLPDGLSGGDTMPCLNTHTHMFSCRAICTGVQSRWISPVWGRYSPRRICAMVDFPKPEELTMKVSSWVGMKREMHLRTGMEAELVAIKQVQKTAVSSPAPILPSFTSFEPNLNPCTNIAIVTNCTLPPLAPHTILILPAAPSGRTSTSSSEHRLYGVALNAFTVRMKRGRG